MDQSFADQLELGLSADITGWDFAWLEGHATEGRRPDVETAQAKEAGLEIVDLQTATLRIELFDVAAAVYLLRKVIWWVPGFTVEKYRDRLWDLHQQIQADGVFVAHSTRHLIEAKRQ